MDADVDARERDQRRQREQRPGEAGDGERERRRAGEGDGRRGRTGTSRSRAGRRAAAAIGSATGGRSRSIHCFSAPEMLSEIRIAHGDARPEPGAAPGEARDRNRDREPDEAERARVRERLEERVEHAEPVVDDPVPELAVEAAQRGRYETGSCCFVDSISERGSNGLPMKPWTPRDAASDADSSSTLPGEHDHGDRADAGVLLDPAQRLPAVDLRHHHVEQDQVGRALAERREPFLGASRLADLVALGLEVDADVLAQRLRRRPRSGRAGRTSRWRRPAGPGPVEELIEVGAAVAAVAAGGIERGDTAEIRPLPHRALRDAEIFRGLPQRQPFGLGCGGAHGFRRMPSAVNLPKPDGT